MSQYENIGQKELSIYGKQLSSENQFRISRMNSMKRNKDEQVVIEEVKKSVIGHYT